MSKQEIIKAWKNPELRANTNVAHPSGTSFTELSVEEMVKIQGAGDGDMNAMTTPLTLSSTSCWATIGYTLSKLTC